MTFPQASRLAAQHDVVMVGYRGVDGSSVLNCPEVTAALENSADYLGKASLSAYSQAFASCAKRLERSGVDLAGYTLAEQADDIEAARVALGYKRIDLLSESAGTRLGDDLPVAVPEQCRPLGDGRGQPARELHLQRSRDRSGDRALLGAVREAACLPRPHRKPRREHAAHGGTHAEQLVIPADQAGQRPGRDVPRAHGGELGRRFDTVRADDPRLVDLRRAGRPERPVAALVAVRSSSSPSRSSGASLPASGWPTRSPSSAISAPARTGARSSAIPSGSSCGGQEAWLHAWPANPGENQYTSVQNSSVPTLLIGGTLDFETPAQNATKELLPHLSNGHQVILSGLGHVDDFDAYEPKASTQLLTTFYATGQVDTSRYTPNVVSFTTSQYAGSDCQGHPWVNDRLRLVGSDLARGVGDPDPPPRRYRPQDGRMDPFGRSDRVRTRRMVPRRTVGTAVLAEPAARRPAAGSGLGRGADLARGLRRLGPHRHAEGDAGQGHRCRGCRCGGRSRTRFPRDQRAHGVDHDDHRCGGRVEPEPARARHLDRAGRLPGNGRSGSGKPPISRAPAVDLSETEHLEPALH